MDYFQPGAPEAPVFDSEVCNRDLQEQELIDQDITHSQYLGSPLQTSVGDDMVIINSNVGKSHVESDEEALAQVQSPTFANCDTSGHSSFIEELFGPELDEGSPAQVQSPTLPNCDIADHSSFMEQLFGPEWNDETVMPEDQALNSSATELMDDILYETASSSDVQEQIGNLQHVNKGEANGTYNDEPAHEPYDVPNEGQGLGIGTFNGLFLDEALAMRNDGVKLTEVLAKRPDMVAKSKPAEPTKGTLSGRIRKPKAALSKLTFPTVSQTGYAGEQPNSPSGDQTAHAKVQKQSELPVASISGTGLSNGTVLALIQARQAAAQRAKLQNRQHRHELSASPVLHQTAQKQDGQLSQQQASQLLPHQQVAQAHSSPAAPNEIHGQAFPFQAFQGTQQQNGMVEANQQVYSGNIQLQAHQITRQQNIQVPAYQQNQIRAAQLQNSPLQNGQLQYGQLQNTRLQNIPPQYGRFQNSPLQNSPLQNSPPLYGQLQSGQLQSGQLQSGQLRSGQLQSGQLQSGQLQSGQLQSGQLQSGQIQYGQFHNGQFPHSQFQNGQFQNGQSQNSQFQSGQVQHIQPQSYQTQNSQSSRAQLQNGQSPYDQFQDGQSQSGQFQSGQSQSGQSQNIQFQNGHVQHVQPQSYQTQNGQSGRVQHLNGQMNNNQSDPTQYFQTIQHHHAPFQPNQFSTHVGQIQPQGFQHQNSQILPGNRSSLETQYQKAQLAIKKAQQKAMQLESQMAQLRSGQMLHQAPGNNCLQSGNFPQQQQFQTQNEIQSQILTPANTPRQRQVLSHQAVQYPINAPLTPQLQSRSPASNSLLGSPKKRSPRRTQGNVQNRRSLIQTPPNSLPPTPQSQFGTPPQQSDSADETPEDTTPAKPATSANFWSGILVCTMDQIETQANFQRMQGQFTYPPQDDFLSQPENFNSGTLPK